jgi:hypothetical protein
MAAVTQNGLALKFADKDFEMHLDLYDWTRMCHIYIYIYCRCESQEEP